MEFADEPNPATAREPAIVSLPVTWSDPPMVALCVTTSDPPAYTFPPIPTPPITSSAPVRVSVDTVESDIIRVPVTVEFAEEMNPATPNEPTIV